MNERDDEFRRINARLAELYRERDALLARRAEVTGARSLSLTPEYAVWNALRGRCLNENNPGFKNYGGRGIEVCPRWANSFEAFIDDVGLRPGPGYSLDRIDNDGNYEPGNVRWATAKEQANNRRPGPHFRRGGRNYERYCELGLV